MADTLKRVFDSLTEEQQCVAGHVGRYLAYDLYPELVERAIEAQDQAALSALRALSIQQRDKALEEFGITGMVDRLKQRAQSQPKPEEGELAVWDKQSAESILWLCDIEVPKLPNPTHEDGRDYLRI